MQLLFQVVSLSAVVSAITVRDLMRRQDLPSDVPSDCVTSCDALSEQANFCGADLTCLCAPTVINDFQQCANCVVALAPDEQNVVQSDADELVSGCREGGFDIPDITVTGDFSGSGSSSGDSTSLPSDSFPSTTSPAFGGSFSTTQSLTPFPSPTTNASDNGNSGDGSDTGSSSGAGNGNSGTGTGSSGTGAGSSGTGSGSSGSGGGSSSSGSGSGSGSSGFGSGNTGSGSGNSGSNGKSGAYGSYEQLQTLFIYSLSIGAAFILVVSY